MAEITTHRISSVPTDITDVNNDFEISRTEDGVYRIVLNNIATYAGRRVERIDFYSKDKKQGVTNEVLLACVLDRLRQFQLGEQGCPENALVIEYLEKTLFKLKERTIRLVYEKELNKVNTKSEPNVVVSAGKLCIGTDNFTAEELKKWGTWTTVGAAIRQLQVPLKTEELEMIRSIAYFSSPAAMTGFTELWQFLLQQGLLKEENTVSKGSKGSRISATEAVLTVGDVKFTQEELKKWGMWAIVESTIKKFDSPLTAEEFAVITTFATELSLAAKHGLAELKQALKQADKL